VRAASVCATIHLQQRGSEVIAVQGDSGEAWGCGAVSPGRQPRALLPCGHAHHAEHRPGPGPQELADGSVDDAYLDVLDEDQDAVSAEADG
jgi:hypothetical protein